MNITTYFSSLAIAILLTSYSSAKDPAPLSNQSEIVNDPTKNVDLVKSALDAIYQGRLPELTIRLTPDFVDYEAGDTPSAGESSLVAFSNEIRQALINMTFQTTHIETFENKVLVFGRITGVFHGPFRDLVPHGKPVTLNTVELFELSNRAIKSRRGIRDLKSLAILSDPISNQSGIVPSPSGNVNPSNIGIKKEKSASVTTTPPESGSKKPGIKDTKNK